MRLPEIHPALFSLALAALGHVFHAVTGERSRIRQYFLRLYIIYEVKFLRLVLWGINTPIGRTRLGEKLIWWFFGAWLKRWAETGRAMSADEVRHFFTTLPPEFETAIGNCRCKIARGAPCRRFYDGTCTHPRETEITVRWGTRFYREGYPGEYRLIPREEAVKRIEALRAMRHAPHMYFFCVADGREGKEFVICNCCKGACVPIEVNRRRMPIMSRGTGRAVVDYAKCVSCFTCREVCLYDVVGERGGKPFIGNCHGCAVCVHNCRAAALSMVPGTEG
jgi:Pyruvate/2-oxoacid:ferredoxin oxidoreductase delta subunit